MKHIMKIFSKIWLLPVALTVITLISCSKDGNPNKLSVDIPESEITGSANDGVTKILTIGNSFSEDAVESYLHELAQAEGHTVIIGNMYIGGSSLAEHVQNARNNASVYSYRKIGADGVKKTYEKTSLSTAIADEQWDYISFQQVSQNSGQYETIEESLPELYDYVRERAKNPDVKYILHRTWAYAQSSTHSGFANYNNDQMTMYDAIINAYDKAKTLINASMIVPTGTAIQNARTSLLGDNLTRDGYHLSIPMGRYTAACTWFEAIFGSNVIDNAFVPVDMTAKEDSIAKYAAHYAVQNPDEITVLEEFQGGSAGFSGNININFGTAAAPLGWNGATGYLEGFSLALTDEDGNETGVNLEVIERLGGANTTGEPATTTSLNMPEAVSKSAYYGNAGAAFNGMVIEKGVLKISGLDKNEKYNFCYFGSRVGVTDNRETKFITTGKNEITVSQNSSMNATIVSCTSDIQPTDDGEVMITITAGDNNNNGNKFYYINAMRITKSE